MQRFIKLLLVIYLCFLIYQPIPYHWNLPTIRPQPQTIAGRNTIRSQCSCEFTLWAQHTQSNVFFLRVFRPVKKKKKNITAQPAARFAEKRFTEKRSRTLRYKPSNLQNNSASCDFLRFSRILFLYFGLAGKCHRIIEKTFSFSLFCVGLLAVVSGNKVPCSKWFT